MYNQWRTLNRMSETAEWWYLANELRGGLNVSAISVSVNEFAVYVCGLFCLIVNSVQCATFKLIDSAIFQPTVR